MFITIVAYQLEGRDSKHHLHELVAQTLSEFDLTGTID